MSQSAVIIKPSPVKTLIKTLVVVAMVSIAFFSVAYFINSDRGGAVVINNQEIKVEVVKTPEDMAKGLGGRKNLPENSGMIFIYDGYYTPKFWMKDMRFPIDIIWIKDNMVTGFEKNVPVSTQNPLPTYQPTDFINYVLEVNAGFVDKNGIKIGDGVEIKL